MKRLLFIPLAVAPFISVAQKAVSAYTLTSETPTASQTLGVSGYTTPTTPENFPATNSYDIYYGQQPASVAGTNRVVSGFTAGGHTFTPYVTTGFTPFDLVTIKRVDNSAVTGEKFSAFYQYNSITNSAGTAVASPSSSTIPNNGKVYLSPEQATTMEGLLNSYIINRGTDNLFSNVNTDNTYNNVERVDMILTDGIVANTYPNNLNVTGFLINERNGNDNFKVAAITSINSSDEVVTLGTVTTILMANWGKVGGNVTSVVFQQDGGTGDYRPSQALASQTISGVFISLADLGIPLGTTIYGISILPNDAATDVVGLTDAVTSTNQTNSGIDLMAGNFSAQLSVAADISGNVFNDINGGDVNNSSGSAVVPLGLHAIILDSLGNIITSTIVDAAAGTYSFADVPPGKYSIVLSTTVGAAGSAPTITLPTGWVNTGEYTGPPDSGNDGTPDSRSETFVVAQTDISNINFAIEETPESDDKTTSIDQPVSGQEIVLDGTGTNPPYLTGSDPVAMPASDNLQGETVAITSLATNGQLRYDGVDILTGADGINPPSVTNPFLITEFDPALLSIVLTGTGYTSTSFTYAFVDSAGVVDPTPATYSLDWDSPLPLDLTTFTAEISNNAVGLKWETQNEKQVSHFEVERSKDARVFNVIGHVKSNTEHAANSYQYLDMAPEQGLDYYRLKIVDSDKKYKYSEVVKVIWNVKQQQPLVLYPNPANSLVHVNAASTATIDVLDIKGSRMQVSIFTNDNLRVIKTESLPAGTYFVKITAAAASTTHKLIIRK